jgi:hypothetical protein|tara:strand:- start:431 stop:718 length:288 start_codon:yes stop_codon:yes gene_type:complete
MRYNKVKMHKDSTGSRYRESLTIPKIPVSADDRYVEVSVTDRLDLISHKFYGTREHWWIIAAANNLGKGTLNIQEGGVLRLPADPSTFTNKASGY